MISDNDIKVKKPLRIGYLRRVEEESTIVHKTSIHRGKNIGSCGSEERKGTYTTHIINDKLYRQVKENDRNAKFLKLKRCISCSFINDPIMEEN